ncbi:aldehyde dehydrogenase family protein [Gordonia sp. HY002]|uniref:aldehyde dehydrogenase family protein n=1 Tax=Gordonia zhenghanii TaxID=2911516 RepID=UPI001EEF92EC|nr:aldehyde dehydrogenase family protein [Gordonia zhenghanii]MCF8570978.1 aldehyde dehydrogenase family protein [Gordonia zhenghanii]MCF8604721.1 aldehyde dehydrogenase family protein [Gordonia zhenghanii]
MSGHAPVVGANLVGGDWVQAASGAVFGSVEPADPRRVVGTFPESSAEDVRAAVDGLKEAAPEWAATSPECRASILEAAADALESRAAQLIEEMSREEGKTRAEASVEVGRTPMNLRFYAAEAMRSGGQTFPAANGTLVYTVREPVGLVGAITPWNFPLNIPSRKIGPALAAGDTVLFKPSELTPLMGQRLVEALIAGGLPPSAIALVQGGSTAGAAITADERVDAVTFTGSTDVGRAIHRQVGPDRRVQLEMGGKNPTVVLADADIEMAAAIVVKGAFGLSGQACTGTSRLIVVDEIHDALVDAVVARAEKITVGAGLDPGVMMGPLASESQQRKYREYVAAGVAEGAVLRGAVSSIDGPGYFARPVVFTDTTPGMRIVTDEIFGPVLAVQRARDYDEAVSLANATGFGLSAAIITRDVGRAMAFADESRTGLVKINQPTSGMAMNAPFGGYKASSTQTFKEQAGASMMQFYQSEKTIYLTSAG